MPDFDKPLLMLAPLAGYTDLPFRGLVKRYGADITVSEMISANALRYGNQKTLKMLEKSENETPYSIQIAGYDASSIREAVEILNPMEGIDIIDLNCGCPAKKVVGNASGSYLLNDLIHLREIVATIKKHSAKPYTSVKTRLGYERKNPVDIAKAIEDGGADFMVVHGRTKSDGYKKERIDYDTIALMKASVNIPVIANGDICSFEDAARVLDTTGADGIMIGRAAVGNPFIFMQIKEGSEEIDPAVKKEVVLEHFDRMLEFYGGHGMRMFRKHLHTYSKGHREAGAFRDRVNRIDASAQMREEIKRFF